jgi:hypothetical protein
LSLIIVLFSSVVNSQVLHTSLDLAIITLGRLLLQAQARCSAASAWATDESGDWQSLHAASAVSVAAITAAAAMIESTAAAGVCMQHAEAEAEVQPVAAVQVAAALPSSLPQPAAGRATKAFF